MKFYLKPLKTVRTWNNATLMIEMKRIAIQPLTLGVEKFRFVMENMLLGDGTHTRNFTPPGFFTQQVFMERDVSSSELVKVELKLQPGFEIKWNYNIDIEDPKPTSSYRNWIAPRFKRFCFD